MSEFKVLMKRHEKYEGKISDELYQILEQLYCQITEEKGVEIKDELDLLREIKYSIPADEKMKREIYYTRWCIIIENLLSNNYEKNDIDYYIRSNCLKEMEMSLKEMEMIGFGYYYDVKFKKQETTLYSVGYGKESSWKDWRYKNLKDNKIKENGIEYVFKACKEHINIGGNVRLKSLSKCLGVDIFKYMHLDENNNANLYIIKDAQINFLQFGGNDNRRIYSLQEYTLSDEEFDINDNPQFCLDFSYPRNGKINNYNKWSKRFLGEGNYISVAEVNTRKADYGIESNDNELDIFILNELRMERKQVADRAISSRISPIADKEVIASDDFWPLVEYSPELSENSIKEEMCYHITFNQAEYCQLIYTYFKNYAYHKKGKNDYDEHYYKVLKKEIEHCNNKIDELKVQNEQLKLALNEEVNDDRTKEHKQKEEEYEKNTLRINIYSYYVDFLEKVKFEDETKNKIDFALSFVDWRKEEMPKEWSTENIYHSKENMKNNWCVNSYKCICKNIVFE